MKHPFPSTRPFTTAALAGSADIQSIQAFYGSIATIDDALILIEAVRRRKAPRVHHRLTEDEQLAIGSGSIFVWNEEEAQIKRWTDGRHWSNSRMKGRFFLYKELSASKKTGTTRGRVAIAAVAAAAAAAAAAPSAPNTSKSAPSASASTSPQENISDPTPTGDREVGVTGTVAGEEEPSTVPNNRRSTKSSKKRKAVEESASDRLFLRKKTISVRTRKNERYHLVAYYYEHEEASLTRPSQVPLFAELAIEPGFYLTGLDSTPLMVANQTAAPPSAPIGSPSAAAAVEAFRPASPISQGHLPTASDSGIASRQAVPVSRNTSYMANSITEPHSHATYGPSYPTMAPPRQTHSAAFAPPAAPSAYPQSWPTHASSPVDMYHQHASGDSFPDNYRNGYSQPAAYRGGWPSGFPESRDRDYPTYDRTRPPGHGSDRSHAMHSTSSAAHGASNARNDPVNSPNSTSHGHPTPISVDYDHHGTPGSWESASSAARFDSGSYSRHPVSANTYPAPPVSTRNNDPPPAHLSPGYYYPPTPTSYGFGDPFGYHAPPPSAGGPTSYSGSAYPGYPVMGAPSYYAQAPVHAYSDHHGGPAYLDASIATSYYPPPPPHYPNTPRSAKPIGMEYPSDVPGETAGREL